MAGLPPNELFSVLAFIGFILAGLPLPWHIQHSWNTGTCMFMLWASLGCLITFINSIVWNDNVTNWAPGWCDISAHYIIGSVIGLPASALCIIRRLYYMTNVQRITVGRKERRLEIIFDISVGVGFPCIIMALMYIVQDHRFIILEQIGCYYSVANTLAAALLIPMWPLVLSLISLVYAVLTFRRAFRLQGELKRVLETGFSISTGRYWRLMALCSAEIILAVPLGFYILIGSTVDDQLAPYSWSSIHSHFSQISQYPTAVWQNEYGYAQEVETTRWIYVLCAFVIFAFFGWGQEARGFYSQAFWSVCRYLGCSEPHRPPLPTAFPKRRRRADEPTLSDDSVDQREGPGSPSVPIRARVKHHFRSSFSFQAPPRSQVESTVASQPSMDEGSTDRPPYLAPLNGIARQADTTLEGTPATPDLMLTADRRSQISSQDVQIDQQV